MKKQAKKCLHKTTAAILKLQPHIDYEFYPEGPDAMLLMEEMTKILLEPARQKALSEVRRYFQGVLGKKRANALVPSPSKIKQTLREYKKLKWKCVGVYPCGHKKYKIIKEKNKK